MYNNTNPVERPRPVRAAQRKPRNCQNEGDSKKLRLGPNVDKEIEHLEKTCIGCQQIQNNTSSVPLRPWEWPTGAWQRLHIDFGVGNMFLIVADAHCK